MMKRALAIAVATVGFSTTLVSTPAQAAPLGVNLSHLYTDSVTLRVVCPVDPPTNVIVSVDGTFSGIQPIDCVGGGHKQTVTVAISPALAPRSVHDLDVTVSGDSGEINASFDNVRVSSR